jgi:hypothetical protein
VASLYAAHRLRHLWGTTQPRESPLRLLHETITASNRESGEEPSSKTDADGKGEAKPSPVATEPSAFTSAPPPPAPPPRPRMKMRNGTVTEKQKSSAPAVSPTVLIGCAVMLVCFFLSNATEPGSLSHELVGDVIPMTVCFVIILRQVGFAAAVTTGAGILACARRPLSWRQRYNERLALWIALIGIVVWSLWPAMLMIALPFALPLAAAVGAVWLIFGHPLAVIAFAAIALVVILANQQRQRGTETGDGREWKWKWKREIVLTIAAAVSRL